MAGRGDKDSGKMVRIYSQGQQCCPLLCRLLKDGQHARLLSFPDQFNQDVSQWLHARLAAAGAQQAKATTLRQLTWLHELRMKQYDSAARTLADVTNNNEVIMGLNCSCSYIMTVLYQQALFASGFRCMHSLLRAMHALDCPQGSAHAPGVGSSFCWPTCA